jgi:uncharacterized protein
MMLMPKYDWYAFKILIACVAVFVLQNIFPEITDLFSLDSQLVFLRPWTMITYMFLHGSFQHIFFNMLALGMFGSLLESIIGGRKFLIIYFVSGIAAGIGSLIFYTSSIGASGAVYGILGALAVLRPGMTVYVSFFPLPMFLAVFFWAAGDLLGLISPGDLIAHAAHLFGLVFGLSYGMLLRKKYADHHSRRPKGNVSDEEINRWESSYMSN